MDDDRDEILNAAGHRANQSAGMRAMLQNQRASVWPSPNSRVASALRKIDRYVSPNVVAEVNDAFQAIFVEQNGLNTPKIDVRVKSEFFQAELGSIDTHSQGLSSYIRAKIRVMPGKEKELEDILQAAGINEGYLNKDTLNCYHKYKHSDYSEFTIDAESFDKILGAVVDGHINKNYPEYAVDYKRILREETLSVQTGKGAAR